MIMFVSTRKIQFLISKEIQYRFSLKIGKKLRKVMFVIFFLVSFSIVTNTHALDPDLIAAWTFEEGKGETTADITGKGHTGKLIGNPIWVEGKYGKGLEIVDWLQYMLVEDANDLHFGNTDFTFVAWIYIYKFVPGMYHSILCKRDPDSPPKSCVRWSIYVNGRMQELALEPGGFFYSNTELEERRWYHVGVVKTKEKATLYLNGKRNGWEPREMNESLTSEEPLYIGVQYIFHNWQVWNDTLNGIIDEVGIYNRALTDEEMASVIWSVDVKPSGKIETSWGYIKSKY